MKYSRQISSARIFSRFARKMLNFVYFWPLWVNESNFFEQINQLESTKINLVIVWFKEITFYTNISILSYLQSISHIFYMRNWANMSALIWAIVKVIVLFFFLPLKRTKKCVGIEIRATFNFWRKKKFNALIFYIQFSCHSNVKTSNKSMYNYNL